MKAAIFEGLHKPLVCKEWPNPDPKEGEVLVKLEAAALNRRDVYIQTDQYAGIRFPVVLGSDGSGIVSETGATDSSLLWNEVIINPGFYWGENPAFQSKNFKILGMPADGTFAEFVCVPEEYIYTKPSHLSYEEAAALPLAGLTAYRAAFTRGKLKAGDKLFITGIGGGVALLTLQFAIAVGAEVYVSSGSDEKIAKAVELGAKGGVNYKTQAWHKELIEKTGGVDLVIDSACGNDFGKLIDVVKPGGTISVYGGTQGKINGIIPAKLFWRQINIVGSTMGTQDDFKEMLELVNDKKIKPIIDKVYSLNQAEQAMRRLESGEQFGKVVISV